MERREERRGKVLAAPNPATPDRGANVAGIQFWEIVTDLTVILLLLAILGAVKIGMNQVIRGLESLDERLAGSEDRGDAQRS